MNKYIEVDELYQMPDGLSENIDRSLKDHFCIQSLALTTIPDKIKRECESALLKVGNNELRFIDYEKAQHKERVCAYKNFINRIDTNTNTREPTTDSTTK